MFTDTFPSTSRREEDGGGEHEKDFFRLFYFPSESFYNGDMTVRTSLRNIKQPLQGAASAVMGGIFSAVDSALTMLNEEFESPSESMVSTATYGDDEEDSPVENCQQPNRPTSESGMICAATKSKIVRCRKRVSPDKECTDGKNLLRTSEANQSPAENTTQVANCDQLENDQATTPNMGSSHMSSASVTDDSDAKNRFQDASDDDFMSESEGMNSENLGLAIRNPTSPPVPNSELIFNSPVTADDCSVTDRKGEELDYLDLVEDQQLDDASFCIIASERETAEGWLVVSDE